MEKIKKKVIVTNIVKEKNESKSSKKINYFDDNEANENVEKDLDSCNKKKLKDYCPMGRRRQFAMLVNILGSQNQL